MGGEGWEVGVGVRGGRWGWGGGREVGGGVSQDNLV